MSVNEDMRLVGLARSSRGGDNDWMPSRLAETCREPDIPAMGNKPLGALHQIPGVALLRGDAGEAQVLAKLAKEPFLMALQVGGDRLHAGFVYQEVAHKRNVKVPLIENPVEPVTFPAR